MTCPHCEQREREWEAERKDLLDRYHEMKRRADRATTAEGVLRENLERLQRASAAAQARRKLRAAGQVDLSDRFDALETAQARIDELERMIRRQA